MSVKCNNTIVQTKSWITVTAKYSLKTPDKQRPHNTGQSFIRFLVTLEFLYLRMKPGT